MTIHLQIIACEKELIIRERAAKHLKGIPKRQNETEMERLSDRLTHLQIALLEDNGNALRAAAIRRMEERERGNGHI